MKREPIVERILSARLVVVIRNPDQSKVPVIVGALVEAGIQVLEITSNTPGFEEEISAARSRFPQVLIGAGTITEPSLVAKAAEAGAQFLVTPNVNAEVCSSAHELGLPVLMGALTPTEVGSAVAAGADIIKIFPADLLGIPYLKALMGPFGETPFFAVGGIRKDDAPAWLDAGARGLGVGGKLTELTNGDTRGIVESAKEFLSTLSHS